MRYLMIGLIILILVLVIQLLEVSFHRFYNMNYKDYWTEKHAQKEMAKTKFIALNIGIIFIGFFWVIIGYIFQFIGALFG